MDILNGGGSQIADLLRQAGMANWDEGIASPIPAGQLPRGAAPIGLAPVLAPGQRPEGSAPIPLAPVVPPGQLPQGAMPMEGNLQAQIQQDGKDVFSKMLQAVMGRTEAVTDAQARLQRYGADDRVTSILKARQASEDQYPSDLPGALTMLGRNLRDAQQAGFRSAASISTTGDRKYISFGEALNSMKAQRLAEAESLAKIQIEDEKLKNQEAFNKRQELSTLMTLYMTERQRTETERHNKATESAAVIKEVMAPLDKMASEGSVPAVDHAKITSAVMSAVQKSGASTPTEVAAVATKTLMENGVQNYAKIMHVGNSLFAVSPGPDGVPKTKLIGSAEPTNSSPWHDGGPVMDRNTGEFLGYLQFNSVNSERYIRTKDGKLVPAGAIPNAVPVTRSDLNQSLTPEQTLKVSDDLNTERQSINALTRYMKFVNESPQGWGLFANEVIGKVKTVLGDKITPKELNVLAQSGQLQGLIGRMRLQIVGGGVMTEQDAVRIIAALGGDVNAIRNPDVVRTLLGQLVQMKAERYNNVVLPTYNRQSQMYPNIYPRAEPITIDTKMFEVNQAGWPEGATAERTGPDGRAQYWIPSEGKWVSPKATKK